MLMMDVLGGAVRRPPPVWMMRQAGRYLPEYREVRAEAGDFLRLCLNPALAAEVTLQPIRRYGFDAAILFSDILILPMALGQGLRFAEGEGPRLPPLHDLAGLDIAGAAAIYAPILETVGRVRAGLAAEAALIGFCGGPFTVACYMLDGQGGGFPRTQAMAQAGDGLLSDLVELLAGASVAYLQGQIDAGADCVMIFESWAGILAPDEFRKLVIEPNRRMVAALRARTPGLRVIGFPRLCGGMLGEYVRQTGVDAVSLDSGVAASQAIADCPAGTVFQGNLDPDLLRQGGAALVAGTKAVLAGFAGAPHIFNLGHGITPDVDPAHVSLMIETIRAAG